MTVSSEAKRTLVKSPPELWSEVSDAESLARHLDGVEQIKITRVEPETAIEWEADGASGSVRLQPSGFGTKVTLSLSRELPEPPGEPATAEHEPTVPEPVAMEPEPEVLEPVADEPELAMPEPVAADPVPVAADPVPVAADPVPVVADPEPVVAEPEPAAEPEPRRGFFARLFKRRHKPPPPEPAASIESEPEPAAVAEPEPEAVEAVEHETKSAEAVEHEPEPEQAPNPVDSPASVTADLAALEAQMAEQDEAMLTAMLDRLGAAHHRPFSRS